MSSKRETGTTVENPVQAIALALALALVTVTLVETANQTVNAENTENKVPPEDGN